MVYAVKSIEPRQKQMEICSVTTLPRSNAHGQFPEQNNTHRRFYNKKLQTHERAIHHDPEKMQQTRVVCQKLEIEQSDKYWKEEIEFNQASWE